ncbi:MAG: hypothetical protein ABIK37_05185 [candidate division WOR-3 bacterium]
MAQTLKDFVEEFYQMVSPVIAGGLNAAMAQWDRAYVIKLLNRGWEKAATDVGGLLWTATTDLVADQENYALPDSIVSLDKVIVRRGGQVCSELLPQAAAPLEYPDGSHASGVPRFCSWKLQKHDDAQSGYELRILPPASWSEADGLWAVGRVLPDTITSDSDVPDCRDSLAQMGLAWACYLATGQQRYVVIDYTSAKRDFIRRGLVNQPVPKSGVWQTMNSINTRWLGGMR